MGWFRTPGDGPTAAAAGRSVMILRTDPRGRVVYVNDTLCRVTGFAAHELVGENAAKLRHPDMPGVVLGRIWQAIERGEEIFVHLINRRRGGHPLWIFAHIMPTVDRSGKIVSCCSVQRAASKRAIAHLEPLYAELRGLERAGDEDAARARFGAWLRDHGGNLARCMFALREG